MLFFVSKSDICNFADDNTLSFCEKMLGDILHNLKFDLEHVLKWFKVNSSKPNPGKFQFMISGANTDIKVNLFLDGNKIEKSQVVLLTITIGDKLSFKTRTENICRKAKYKLHALQYIRKYLSTDKAKTLCNAFINSQFYYAPLIWVFAGKLLISRVQKIRFRSLQVVHNTYDTIYDELLSMDSDVSIHQRHLHFLVTEVFKSVNNLNPYFMRDYFKTIFSPYDLRKVNTLLLPPAYSTCHGINSLLFRGNILWNNLPKEIKESLSTEEFKKRRKEHGALPCSCVVCR